MFYASYDNTQSYIPLFPELSDDIQKAIKEENVNYLEQIPQGPARKDICQSRTKLLWLIPQYSLLEFTLKHNKITLYKYFVLNSDWSEYLDLTHLKKAASVYQSAIEHNEEKLIGIFKQNLENLNQETSQKLQKILFSCNLFKNQQLNSNMSAIIVDYVDPMAIALKL